MKIGIVGSGFVGATAAYAMVMGGVGREIVLIDKDNQRSKAEASDIMHAVPFAHPMKIRQGGYKDLKGSSLVIISAGVSQKPGETRLDLLKRNATVFKDIIPYIIEYAPDTIMIVATNPLDIMTYLAVHYAEDAGMRKSRVLGTGTMLDTARFRTLLGELVGVDPQHIHGYVVGEHGDSEVLTWSLATVGSIHLKEFCKQKEIPFDEKVKQNIDDQVRNAAYRIIEGKGSTYYGIGSALAKLADVILHDQRSILTVSTPLVDLEGLPDVSLSLPHLIGGEGIMDSSPLPLDDRESAGLKKSAAVIRYALNELSDIF